MPVTSNTRSPLEKLVNTRCYYNQPAHLIGVFTTEVLVFPQDLSFTNSDTFKMIIDDACNYDGVIMDNRVLESIDKLIPVGRQDYSLYRTLGLYLYLADEVSRTKGPKTFLEAARANHSNMHMDEQLEVILNNKSDHLRHNKAYDLRKKWFITTLEDLDLYQHSHIQKLVNDWVRTGNFEVCGEVQSCTPTMAVGCYAELAKIICDPRQKQAQISDCIAKALGSKEKFVGKSQEYIFNYVKDTVQSVYNLNGMNNMVKFSVNNDEGVSLKPLNVESVSQFFNSLRNIFEKTSELHRDISTGMNIRMNRLANKVREKIYTSGEEVTTLSTEGQKVFKDIFSTFPNEIISALDAMHYRFAYTNSPSIEPIYPKEHMGLGKKETDDTKGAIANHFIRYKLIMFSNGIGREGNVINKAQTIFHEVFHAIANSSVVRKSEELTKQVAELFSDTIDLFTIKNPNPIPNWVVTDLLEKIPCKSIQGASVKDIIDAHSKSYTNYRNFDSKGNKVVDKVIGEEICANILGLMNTEFSERNRPQCNPFQKNFTAEDQIYKLSKRINDFIKTVAVEITAQASKAESLQK